MCAKNIGAYTVVCKDWFRHKSVQMHFLVSDVKMQI